MVLFLSGFLVHFCQCVSLLGELVLQHPDFSEAVWMEHIGEVSTSAGKSSVSVRGSVMIGCLVAGD